MILPRSENQETDADRNGQRDGHSPCRLRNHVDRSRGRHHHDHEYALRLTRATALCDQGPASSGESPKYCRDHRANSSGRLRGDPLSSAAGLRQEVVPVQVHDLVPGRHEITHELVLRVVAGIDLGQRPKLRVRAKNEVGGRGGPPDLPGGAVASFVDVDARVRRRRAPQLELRLAVSAWPVTVCIAKNWSEMAPNPRLQRTRVRAPLSRKPLGA
jgi:hypothetical protein